jgi:CheY-like chemotaxis protein
MAEAIPKVLIVDDERLIADTLLTILNREGFSAHACYSGDEALRLCTELDPDILLCDVMMKGVSGIELAIKLTENQCRAKIVLISGQAATADLLETAKQRGYEFQIIAKPVQPPELIKKLRELVEA